MNQPEPGIYYDIPFDQYCDWQALNISTLLHGRRSMLHLKAAMDGPPSHQSYICKAETSGSTGGTTDERSPTMNSGDCSGQRATDPRDTG